MLSYLAGFEGFRHVTIVLVVSELLADDIVHKVAKLVSLGLRKKLEFK